ncbi:MAG: P-type conjugative transfer protein TrbG, partial [Pseudomonadales bacterium RIFCSPLOWO2_02_FULL_63_210]
IAPTQEGYLNAIQVWPFSDGALYQVYTSPGRVTVINLQVGEDLVTVAAGDTVRWIVGDTSSGSGDELRLSVLVKPTRTDLKTNLVITTTRRTYLIELTSTEHAWMASVSWDYPKDRMLALQRRANAAQTAAPVDAGLALEQLRFRYAISGSNPPWKPLRAFDDGQKVYIQFPAGIAQGELPPLFVIGPEGDGQLVNYRFRSPYYIVDRLFGAAELRLGADKGDVVRIERTDGVARRP